MGESRQVDGATVRQLIETFNLSVKDMLHLAQQVMHHVNASPEEREAMAH